MRFERSSPLATTRSYIVRAAVSVLSYSKEAREVMACICAGARESAIMRLDESLSVAMDAVRRQ